MLKFLKLIPELDEDESSYPNDVTRIVEAFAHFGEIISRHDAKIAWEKYSDTFSASWLFLPNDDVDIYNSIRRYFY